MSLLTGELEVLVGAPETAVVAAVLDIVYEADEVKKWLTNNNYSNDRG
jgi:hypothetical protein